MEMNITPTEKFTIDQALQCYLLQQAKAFAEVANIEALKQLRPEDFSLPQIVRLLNRFDSGAGLLTEVHALINEVDHGKSYEDAVKIAFSKAPVPPVAPVGDTDYEDEMSAKEAAFRLPEDAR